MISKPDFHKKIKVVIFYTLTIGIAAFTITACNQNKTTSSSTAVTDTTAVVASAPVVDTNQLNSDWEKFRTDADTRLKQNDDSIAAIKKKLAKLNKEKKLKYEKHLAELRDRNDTLKVRLHSFRIENKEKWAVFKENFVKDLDSVYNPFHDPSGWNE